MIHTLKWFGRSALFGVLWVYIFSIQWGGEPVFNPISDALVKNIVVTSLDQDLGEFFGRLRKAVKVVLADPAQSAKERLE